MQFARVCVAGTFDGLHKGHRALLRAAFKKGNHVVIGLTSDAYIRQYKKDRRISPYKARRAALDAWVDKQQGYTGKSSVFVLHDPYGPAATDAVIDALVVSEATQKRGGEINDIRAKNNIPPVHLIVVPMVLAQDKQTISSKRVSSGVISKTGKLMLPDSMRNELAQPMGHVLTEHLLIDSLKIHAGKTMITIGDQTTKTILESGVTPSLMIIDNKVNRRAFAGLEPILAEKKFKHVPITSGPGFIAHEAISAIKKIFQDKSYPVVLEILGEEDLLTLPVIVNAPDESIVYYGQPPVPAWVCGPITEGIVEVAVTQDQKNRAIELMGKFVHNTK